jgi:hypothetical protein
MRVEGRYRYKRDEYGNASLHHPPYTEIRLITNFDTETNVSLSTVHKFVKNIS